MLACSGSWRNTLVSHSFFSVASPQRLTSVLPSILHPPVNILCEFCCVVFFLAAAKLQYTAHCRWLPSLRMSFLKGNRKECKLMFISYIKQLFTVKTNALNVIVHSYLIMVHNILQTFLALLLFWKITKMLDAYYSKLKQYRTVRAVVEWWRFPWIPPPPLASDFCLLSTEQSSIFKLTEYSVYFPLSLNVKF